MPLTSGGTAKNRGCVGRSAFRPASAEKTLSPDNDHPLTASPLAVYRTAGRLCKKRRREKGIFNVRLDMGQILLSLYHLSGLDLLRRWRRLALRFNIGYDSAKHILAKMPPFEKEKAWGGFVGSVGDATAYAETKREYQWVLTGLPSGPLMPPQARALLDYGALTCPYPCCIDGD